MPNASRVLQSLSKIIHPPLPLTKRQSTQLLNTLNASFRDSLSREHGEAQAETVDAADSGRVGERRPRASRSSAPSSAKQLTTAHLESVLSHPILAISPHHLHKSTSDHGIDLQEFLRQAAEGSATFRTAYQCLENIYHSWEKLSHPSPNQMDGMHLVVRWLVSTALDRQLLIDLESKYRPLPKFIVTALLVEGCHDVLWEWIAAQCDVSRHASESDDAIQHAVGDSLRRTLAAQIRVEGAMDNALATFSRMNKYLRSESAQILPHRALHPSARRLASMVGNSDLVPVGKHSERHYEEMINIVGQGHAYPHPAQRLMILASLWLNHPTRHSLKPAVSYIDSVRQTRLDSELGMALRDPQRNAQFLELCTRTARAAIDRDDHATAKRILDYAKRRCAPDASRDRSTATSKQSRRVRERAENVSILDGLALG